MDNLKRITNLPTRAPGESDEQPPNPARDVQNFVGEVMAVVSKPVDLLNLGVAKLTQGISDALPAFPAARLYRDLVLGWPHSHPHPPTFGFPLPSIGVALLAGSRNVLINGLPAARSGDVGFAAWCGGYYPLFEVFTGSSNVFIGGARASRQFIDFTIHCLPFWGKLTKAGAAMTALGAGFSAVMGAIGVAAAETDQSYYQELADSAESESEAKAAAAQAEAMEIEAQMAGEQSAADIAAMALSMAMGIDPGVTPFNCFGNFITGSPNVLIGGPPMPGWGAGLRGLGKLLKRRALKTTPRNRLNKGCGRVGEPIDVVTGANVDDFIDFTLPAPRFVWRRWYNSQNQGQVGLLGWGFRHEYQHDLRYDRSMSQYAYTDREGATVPFPPFVTDVPSERVAQHGYALKRLSERRFELTSHDRPAIEFEFDEMTEPARMVALRDEGRNFSFDYDRQGRLVGIRLNEEKTVRLVYSPVGLVSEVLLEQPGQETVCVARYQYDDGCLTEFRDALGHVARYKY